MSVLLTSAKKKDAKKDQKRKSNSTSSLGSGYRSGAASQLQSSSVSTLSSSLNLGHLGHNSGGASSRGNVAVWYWKLNGVLTTLMYSRDSAEVWCNGYTLESVVKHDQNYGHMTEFSIYLDDKGSTHHGQILRDPVGNPALYVDGFPIEQYSG